MEFRFKLHSLEQALLKVEDVEALTFLCRDFFTREVKSTKELFGHLIDRNLLSEDEPDILADLLDVMGLHQLLRGLNLSRNTTTTNSPISSYRRLLYRISEDITEDNLKDIKFRLSERLCRSALDPKCSTLAVFLAMERRDLLSSSNLSLLQEVLKQVCPVLVKHIKKFEASEENEADGTPTSTGTMPPTQTQTTEPAPQPPQTVLDEYPMKNLQRGICWIINNFDFNSSKKKTQNNRVGTDVDEDSLRKVFTWLGFQVEVLRDQTKDQMVDSMGKLARIDHRNMDCVACCILSHGLEKGVYGVDGESVELKELSDHLSGLRCPSLNDKPKLFFIQACQGKNKEQAVIIQADGPGSPEVGTQTNGPSDPGLGTQTDGPCSSGDLCTDAIVVQDSIPTQADYMFAMATTHTFEALREEGGSWFIQVLCQTLVQMVPRREQLADILREVNDKVSKMCVNFKKQMPETRSRLRKRVVFPIPKDPPPSLPSSLGQVTSSRTDVKEGS